MMQNGALPKVELILEPGMLRMPPGLGENARGAVLPIAPLIQRLAARLDEAGIAWTVLRNADGLPDFTRYDLDLLTLPRHRTDFVRIVRDCAQTTGWRVAGQIQKRHYDCLLLMQEPATDGPFFLPLDVFTALEFRGLRYLDAEEVLRNRIRTPKGIWTVPPGIEAAITLLKELFPHRLLKENSRDTVHAQVSADPEGFQRTLESAVGPDMSMLLVDAVRRGEWSLSLPDARRLRQAARQKASGWRLAYLHSVLANVAHVFRPALGIVVCLAGADGSGKTTLACGLAEQMFKRPFKACRYIHGNIGVLPRFRDIRAYLVNLVRRSRPVSAAAPEPQALKGMMVPLPAWKSMLLAAYYAADLLLARLWLRRWRGQWSLVIMDRSFYDYYYQLGHRRCPRWYLNLWSCLIPKPDLLFYIEGDAERIHGRKPELTAEEIRIEQDILRGLAARFPFGHRLDGDAGIDAMIAAGRREILGFLFGGLTK
jgi:thymidylate kinase